MKKILESVNYPEDIRKLSINELYRLSDEIRELIIEVVSKNGGHLSSNLGSVELTLALHYSFKTPVDKIVWDVGHQIYTHKIITGRKDRFHTIRQFRGISGFPRRDESEYDVLNTGHASTALSAALGLVFSRDFRGENFNIVAVVGDGSLTGGIALEALNQIGHHKKRLIIVLNDNKMSISPNVGAISKYLNYLQSGQFYVKTKEAIRSIIEPIPKIGDKFVQLAHTIEDGLKKLIVPGLFFEELGIKYVGPINGHSIEELIKTFEEAKKCTRPILIHVVTKKGKGYKAAEKRANWFHSSAPFDIKTGEFIKKSGPPTYSSVFSETVIRLAEKDERIVAITAAMPEGTGLIKFKEKFPERFFDVGIAEQHAVEFAVGLSLGGLKPVLAIYSTFLQRAYDQLIHDVSLMSVPLVVGIDRAGAVSGDGPTHQGIYDISYLRSIPDIILMSPKDENELKDMVYSAFQYKKPVFIRYPKTQGEGVKIKKEFKLIEFKTWEILKEGKEIAILAVGNLVNDALKVSEFLETEKNLKITVVNSRFIKPMDEKTLKEVLKNHKFIITVENGVKIGGFGEGVLSFANDIDFKGKIKILAFPDKVLPQGKESEIRHIYGIDFDGIKRAVLEVLEHKKGKINGFFDKIKNKIQ